MAFSTSAFADGSYHIIKKIPVPGQGGWDYLIVDEAARRLYVSHATQVEVLDVDSGAIVAKILNTLGVHGIAIAPGLGRGFVSDGQTSTVTVFDLRRSRPLAKYQQARSLTESSMTLLRPRSLPSRAGATAQP